jgi:ParB-like chromosome segregation protein Spo0J
VERLPELTIDERARLTESIRQDGVQYPVLVDAQGHVIDGYHRQAICAELGVHCPTEVRNVDPETAERLRVTLNVARRHLPDHVQIELLAPVVDKLWKEETAKSKARMDAGRANARENRMGQEAPSLPKPKTHGLQTRDLVRKRLNAELPAGSKQFSHAQVQCAHAFARLPERAKAEVRAGTKPIHQAIADHKSNKEPAWRAAERERSRQLREQAARIRASYEQSQAASMLNAPPGRLNLPLIRRLDSIYDQLAEAKALDPVEAADGLPLARLAVFGLPEAEWLLAFATAVEMRRAAETPDVPSRRRRRHEVLNPVLAGVERVLLDEASMTETERRVLAYLREQTESVRAVEIAKALKAGESTVEHAIRSLRGAHLIIGTRTGRTVAYELIRADEKMAQPPIADSACEET